VNLIHLEASSDARMHAKPLLKPQARAADPAGHRHDLVRHLPAGEAGEALARSALSQAALGLVGSEILKISAEVRERQAQGKAVCNLTVGDFSPAQFRIPRELESGIAAALASGHTNYPPSDGVPELRQAVCRLFERELGLVYPVSSVLIAGGSRPLIYALFSAILEPGEKVVYPTPSWNNNHYAYLARAQAVEVPTDAASEFMPTAALLAPHLRGARLLCLNTPSNPAGTMLAADEAERIARLVVEENRRREAAGERALIMMYDQVYWMLTFGGRRHATPLDRVPEAAPYTVFVDGISKGFAATGLRVGWMVGPPSLVSRMRDFLGHVGAWAPRPEQMATARLLDDAAATQAYLQGVRGELEARLQSLHRGLQALKAEGLPIDTVVPQGAIYLSAKFGLLGRTIGGVTLRTNEDVRRMLLERAGLAVVPFQAFGLKEETGWFRLSVGAVGLADIEAALVRLRAALAP
jgi:aspartate aminotransferase